MSSESIPFDANEHGPSPEPPLIQGFIVFLESGVGQLNNLLRRFDVSRCRVLSLHVTPQCGAATVRIIVSHPEEGRIILERAGLPIADYQLVGTILPEGVQPLLRVYLPLIQANISVTATHVVPLAGRGKNAVLLEVDSPTRTIEILLAHGFQLIDDKMLAQESPS